MANSKLLTQNDLKNILAHINLGDDSHVELTQTQFNALTDEEKNDGTIYFVTDGINGNVFLDDNTPVGTIAPYGGSTDPAYWLICDGRAVSRTTYAELFAVIGTTYGTGDGSTTFNIPDLRGNVAVGADTNYELGDSGGAETHLHATGNHTLTVAEIPNHTHAVTGGLFWRTWGDASIINSSYASMASASSGSRFYNAGATSGGAGSNSGHNHGNTSTASNMQPYVVTNYIIKYASTVSEHQANIDFYYPVGSYYETSNASFDPNVTWGGTWSLEAEGRVHIGAGANYTAGDTGGSADAIIPYHNHSVSAVTAGITGGSHTHKQQGWNGLKSDSSGTTKEVRSRYIISTDPQETGNIIASTHTHNLPAHNTNYAGTSGNAVGANMQPYIVVNRWHRIA